nr:hypothetical protein [Rhodococcus sp. (in: high G+C Gram-positive bacteria)]
MPLTLCRDGDDWAGTFGVVVDALIADLLPEGSVRTEIVMEDADTGEKSEIVGDLIGVEPGPIGCHITGLSVKLADGTVQTLDLESVERISIN